MTSNTLQNMTRNTMQIADYCTVTNISQKFAVNTLQNITYIYYEVAEYYFYLTNCIMLQPALTVA
jgi:hypothetical protein